MVRLVIKLGLRRCNKNKDKKWWKQTDNNMSCRLLPYNKLILKKFRWTYKMITFLIYMV
jgi:hypothetical protein